jgi:alpha-galactosidase
MTKLHESLRGIRVLSEHRLGGTRVLYRIDGADGHVQLELLPVGKIGEVVPRRGTLEDSPEIRSLPADFGRPPPWKLDSLVQFQLRGEPLAWTFGAGESMRHSPGMERLRYERQDVSVEGDRTTIRTIFKRAAPVPLRVEHRLWHHAGEAGLRVETSLHNEGEAPLTVEMLSSFSLAGITPFAADDAPGRLHLHRYRTWWSAEARHEAVSLESMHFERAWSSGPLRVERFGQVGSMPCRHWFPFVALEDRPAGVLWGAQLATPGSWQLEVVRRCDQLVLSGGQADFEVGHWAKTLAPGEVFTGPTVALATVAGDLDDLARSLTDLQRRAADEQPAPERTLPMQANDWCTIWGSPTEEKTLALAHALQGLGVTYLIIDDGWALRPPGHACQCNGDWVLNLERYPRGLKPVCDELRRLGLVPGIWFEFEVTNQGNPNFDLTEHQLRRGGAPLQVGGRHFWDFRDPWVHEFLAEKLIRFLRENGIGYLKVDYNESIGPGVDGAESLGEGLREHLLGVQVFFRRIRAELPELVIENCSSGGHRLEPSMQALCALGSFSDAHECPEIPIIAANLLRVVLARQTLVWAVLHADDLPRRLAYSLAACFLGRLCISGALAELDAERRAQVTSALRLYREVAPLIRDGRVRRHGPAVEAYRRPRGWQAVRFESAESLLLVVHAFAEAPGSIELPLPAGKWRVAASFPAPGEAWELFPGGLRLTLEGDFSARVLHLTRVE